MSDDDSDSDESENPFEAPVSNGVRVQKDNSDDDDESDS